MAANFALRSDHFPLLHRPPPLLYLNPLHALSRRPRFLLPSGRRRSGFRVSSSGGHGKGEEEEEKRGAVLTGVQRDEASQVGKAIEEEGGGGGGRGGVVFDGSFEGFEWKWPPWRDLPQRYKLIGTTSLAFVICNMDKVSSPIQDFF